MGVRRSFLRLAHWSAAPLRRGLGRALLFLLIAALNPFDIVQWSENRSHEIWGRIYAHCYEAWQPTKRFSCFRDARPAGPRPRDATTVVYMDQDSLRRVGLKRPISGLELQQMIDDIVYAPRQQPGPLAIFVDMLLTDAAPRDARADKLLALDKAEQAKCTAFQADDPPPSPFRCLLGRVAQLTMYEQWKPDRSCQESTLAKLECIRAKHGLPILFADPRERPDGRIAPTIASPALDALGEVAAAVPVTLDSQRYALAFPANRAMRAHHVFALTPAAALYEIWCKSGEAPGCPESPAETDDQKRPAWSDRFDDPVDVVWGIGSANSFQDMREQYLGGDFGQQCQPAERGILATLGHLGRMSVLGIRPSGKAACPYANAVPNDIFQANISAQHAASMVSRKIVMLGGQFVDSNDVVPAAPFGTVPGVYYHAMALDNLIARGPRYPRPAWTVVPGMTLSSADLFSFAMLIGLATLIEAARQALRQSAFPFRARKRKQWQEVARRSAITLLFGSVIVASTFTVTGLSVLVPDSFNLVAAAVLCILGLGELMWDAIEPFRNRLAERLSLGRIWHSLTREPEKPRKLTKVPKEQLYEGGTDSADASGAGDRQAKDREVPA